MPAPPGAGIFISSGLLQEASAACVGAIIPAQAAIERGRLAKQTRGAHRRAPRKSQPSCRYILFKFFKFLSIVHHCFLPLIPATHALFPTKTALSPFRLHPPPKPCV